jgi:hypothetical protein
MNNDEKGYVIPTPVDTSEEVNKDDSLLSRERDNIISATNQVNNSIDKDMIAETNSKYKIKKTPLIIKFLIYVGSALLIFFVAFYAIKYSKKFIDAGDVTTTTTTSSPLERSKEYWNKNSVRRYIDKDSNVYMFIPEEYGGWVYSISSSVDGPSAIFGTYDNNEVSLTMDDVFELKVTDKGLSLDDIELTISSGEFKYYTYKDDTTTAMLIINASEGLLHGAYINNGSVIEGKYMEYEDRIVLKGIETEYVFQKNGNNVEYNGVKLALQV